MNKHAVKVVELMEAAVNPNVRPAIETMGRLRGDVQSMDRVHMIRDMVLAACTTVEGASPDDTLAGLAMAFAVFALNGKKDIGDHVVVKMRLSEENEADYAADARVEVVPYTIP